MILDEVTYINGAKYKESFIPQIITKNSNLTSTTFDGKVTTDYFQYESEQPFPSLNWFAVKNIDNKEKQVKKYYLTKDIVQHCGQEGGYDLSDIDVCPDIDVCVAFSDYYDESGNVIEGKYDIFFNVINSVNITKIANYYDLPVPLTPSLMENLDINPEYWNNGGWTIIKNTFGFDAESWLNDSFIMAGIRFLDDKPEAFKIYKQQPR